MSECLRSTALRVLHWKKLEQIDRTKKVEAG